MRPNLLLLALACASLLPLHAQSTATVEVPALQAGYAGRVVEAHLLMPTTATRIAFVGSPATETVQVYSLQIHNPTTSAASFSIYDGDGPSMADYTDAELAPKSTYTVQLPVGGYRYKEGVIIRSTSGTLVLRVKGWVAR